MKFRQTAFAALVAGSSAWMPPLTSNHRSHLAKNSVPRQYHQSATGRPQQENGEALSNRSLFHTSTTSLQSAVVEDMNIEDNVAPSQDKKKDSSPRPTTSSSTGKPIAKGSIVSSFPGGLVAVKIDDDLFCNNSDNDDNNPQVVGTTATESLAQSQEMNGGTRSSSTSSNALGGDLIGRRIVFENGKSGVVVVHRPPVLFVYVDSASGESTAATIDEGKATVYDNLVSIEIADSLLQSDCFGRTDSITADAGSDNRTLQRPIFAPIPQVKDIALINKPLITGVTMFDALAPIGKGQNMLFVGHDIEDMRRYVTDILSIQTKGNPPTKCVYASTGTKEDNEQIKNLLESTALDKDVVLVTGDSISSNNNKDEASLAAEATVVAATACAIGESFALEEGIDTLVIVDNIDRHKTIWDTTTRVLVDIFGVDSVVKGDRDGGASSEMRAFFSSLVQRSAQFNSKRGGGSVTLLLLQTVPKIATEKEEIIFSPEDFDQSPDKIKDRVNLLVQKKIPLTAANLRKIQIPVPSADEGKRRLVLQHVDDLISMSDGQIWLDERLEQSGRSPPMDFQRSVTRIGIGADTASRADAAAMRRVVEGLRLDLSQAESMDGADIATNASRKQMRNAQAWLLAMHQPSASGARKLSESCVAMLAASSGAFNDSLDSGVLPGSPEGELLVRNMLDYVSASVPEAIAEIDTTLDFTAETKEVIKEAIKSYFEK